MKRQEKINIIKDLLQGRKQVSDLASQQVYAWYEDRQGLWHGGWNNEKVVYTPEEFEAFCQKHDKATHIKLILWKE